MRLGIVRPFPRKGLRSLALTRYVDALIVNSDEIRREWLETQPDDAHAGVHVVLNAIRSTRSERDANRATLRKELGVSDDILLIGGAGHLSARKGFDILLHGFRDARLADALLVIVGDGDNLKELQSLAQSLGVSGSVRWLGHRENGAELVSGLDVFVLSSHNEGMANVMLEAMAGGAPVIAADISGVAKAIGATDSRPAAGWMYEPGNASRLAATMREVAGLTRGRSPLVTERAEEAHWRIEHWFSPARMIDECEAILFPR